MIYNRFDVVKVPFPFTDRQTSKSRPALVISSYEFNLSVGKSVFAMITSSTKTTWLYDTKIADLTIAGLTVSSSVRMKVFTLDNSFVLARLGQLSAIDCVEFENNFNRLMRQNKLK